MGKSVSQTRRARELWRIVARGMGVSMMRSHPPSTSCMRVIDRCISRFCGAGVLAFSIIRDSTAKHISVCTQRAGYSL